MAENKEEKTKKEEGSLKACCYFRVGLPFFDQEVIEKINSRIFAVLAEVGQEHPNITIKHKVNKEEEDSWIKIY